MLNYFTVGLKKVKHIFDIKNMNENEQHIYYHYRHVKLYIKNNTLKCLNFLRINLRVPMDIFHYVTYNRIFELVFEYNKIVHHYKF